MHQNSERLIENYAHDFRDMAMNEEGLAIMLRRFYRDALSDYSSHLQSVMEGKRRTIGEGTCCEWCKQHIASGDCNCTGFNEGLDESIATLQENI